MSDAAFRLSRIYAEGWNAARKLSSHDGDDMDLWRVSALNPYAAEPERTRWSEGFAKAIWNGLPGVQDGGLHRSHVVSISSLEPVAGSERK